MGYSFGNLVICYLSLLLMNMVVLRSMTDLILPHKVVCVPEPECCSQSIFPD